jgi:hypothetical protein
LHGLLSVPGVSLQVKREIAAIQHDQLVLRMCSVFLEASAVVVHPLLKARLNSLELVGFREYDDDMFVEGSVESLSSEGGLFLLRTFLGHRFDPPLRARLVWRDRDSVESFFLELESWSCQDAQFLSKVFYEMHAQGQAQVRSRSCAKYPWLEQLERLVRDQKSLAETLRTLGVIVVSCDQGKPQMTTRNEYEQGQELGGVGYRHAASQAGLAVKERLDPAEIVGLVLCYLQFDFKFPSRY